MMRVWLRHRRIYVISCLVGCHKRPLIHSPSVLCRILCFCECVLCCSLRLFSLCLVNLCFFCMFSVFVVLIRLSVPVQVIDWKDSSPKWHYNVLMGALNPTYSLTHSLTHSTEFPSRWCIITDKKFAVTQHSCTVKPMLGFSRVLKGTWLCCIMDLTGTCQVIG